MPDGGKAFVRIGNVGGQIGGRKPTALAESRSPSARSDIGAMAFSECAEIALGDQVTPQRTRADRQHRIVQGAIECLAHRAHPRKRPRLRHGRRQPLTAVLKWVCGTLRHYTARSPPRPNHTPA